jgi:hypothetical protein
LRLRWALISSEKCSFDIEPSVKGKDRAILLLDRGGFSIFPRFYKGVAGIILIQPYLIIVVPIDKKVHIFIQPFTYFPEGVCQFWGNGDGGVVGSAVRCQQHPQFSSPRMRGWQIRPQSDMHPLPDLSGAKTA